MSEIQNQSQELAAKMWSIANDLRGNMDSSKFLFKSTLKIDYFFVVGVQFKTY